MYCTHRGKGDAILFIHGMPTNCSLWNGIIEQLDGHYRCFAVDLPGMGKTPFEPYTSRYLDRMADQIEALRLWHGVRKWHVVGHDAGAAVAAHYAARFSTHVGCLALLSPAIFPDLKPYFLLNQLRTPVFGEMLAPFVHLAFWKIAMRRALDGKSNPTQFQAFYQPFSGAAGAWQLMRLVRWGRPEDVLGDIPADLTHLPMPTLIFHGTRDILPAAFAERAASLIPHARVVTLDAGHFLPLHRPKDIAASLRTFFLENHAIMKLPARSRSHGRHRRPPVDPVLTAC